MKLASVFPPLSRRTLGLVVALGLLTVFQLYLLYGLHVSKDLPLWDEAAYLGWGDEFLQDGRVGSITNAPAYHVLYAAVISAAELVPSFFAMQYLLKLTLTALVFLLLVRFSKSVTLSLLLGGFFACSYYHLHIDVLVYYSALIPYLAAILLARPAPMLSLGLSFLAGLGRLEYMAVPVIHLLFLGLSRKAGDREAPSSGWPRLLAAAPATFVWLLNGFILSRISVWQFSNRVWFAWSQNYAFFRHLTGRDAGGNPWLDHQFIAQRDFPTAGSLLEACTVNPAAVLEHTWFNVRELPGYLAAFAVSVPEAGRWRHASLFVLGAIALVGVAALATGRIARKTAAKGPNDGNERTSATTAPVPVIGDRGAAAPPARSWTDRLAHASGDRTLELALCVGGVIAAMPGLIVSSKTNYIMSLLPAALFALGRLQEAAAKFRWYARWSPWAWLAFVLVFSGHLLACPAVYSTRRNPGPVHEDVTTMRALLRPFHGLKILGVSSGSYGNYLGRAKGHVFVEPLAISPVNRQAEDLSLAGLIRAHHPDVLLVNAAWRSSKSYAAAVADFSFEGWEPHALRDGFLYTKRGLVLLPVFDHGWYDEEKAEGRVWRWSRGVAAISFNNSVPDRPATFRFRVRSLVGCNCSVLLDGKVVFAGRLEADAWLPVTLQTDALALGTNQLEFRSDEPPVQAAASDPRKLALCVSAIEVD